MNVLVDVLKKIKIKILPLLGKGIALFLFSLIGYFLFYFAVFSKNPLSFLGFSLVIFFSFFFLEYAFYAFVLTLPLLNQVPQLLNLPLFSPSELLFLCLLNACLLKILFNKKELVFFKSPIDLPIIIFSFVVISSFFSTFVNHYPPDFFYKEKVIGVLKKMLFIHNPYDYSYIFKSTFKILEGTLLFFLITNFIIRGKVLNRIYFLLILGWGIAILLGFVQYFGEILGYERWTMEMSSTFDNPNLFGGYLILIFPFSILYAIDKPFFKRISLSILAMVSIVALILSRSRNSWAAFAILLVLIGIYFLISYLKRSGYKSYINILNWKWIGSLVIFFVIIFGSFYFYLSRGPISGLLAEDVNWRVPIEQKLGLRLPEWKYIVQIVEDFPLWGVGIGEFNFIFQKYSSGHFVSDDGTFQTHNHFLQVAVELGLIGLYAFLWILGGIIRKGFQIMKANQDLKRVGLWFGIIGFIFTFFADSYLWNIEMQLMFWLMIGLLFVDEEENKIEQNHRKSSDKKLCIGLSVIILLTIPFQIYQRSQISFLPEKTVGLYKEVFEEGGREYRWGEKVVLIPLEIMGRSVDIPIKLGNPDIKEKPVKIKVFINKEMVDMLEFRDNDWHILHYSIKNAKGNEIPLKIEVSRTWNPYLMDVRHETRDLGPAIGKIYWSSYL